jgi:hypothetical protein
LINSVRGTLLAIYLITSVHHVDIGLGLVSGSRELGSLLAPLTLGMLLVITLGLLSLYQRTKRRLLLVLFGLMTLLAWVAAIGLFDGFYNHTLTALLALARVPSHTMRAIYPTYWPSTLPMESFACDGSPFRFCRVTPATLLYETTGILQLVGAAVLTLFLARLIRAAWRDTSAENEPIPRLEIGGGSLGFAVAIAAAPFLGAFMSTDTLSFFFTAFPLLSGGALAVLVALVGLGRPFRERQRWLP